MADYMTNKWEIIKYDGNSLTDREDDVAAEFPLTVVLNGEEFATIVCTPSNLNDLVTGFLASEGVIRFSDDIKSLSVSVQRGFAYVELKNPLTVNQESYSKRFIGSCCGKSRQFYFQNDVKTAKTITSKMGVSVEQSFNLMALLQQNSSQFQKTGGVHNAALCSIQDIIVSRTDIGRHNALDKVYGHCIREQVALRDKIIVFSGRISSEVILKVAKIGVGILLSKSAPTDLALKLADDLGITAVGFVRGNKMNIYTHPKRIADTEKK